MSKFDPALIADSELFDSETIADLVFSAVEQSELSIDEYLYVVDHYGNSIELSEFSAFLFNLIRDKIIEIVGYTQ